MLIKLILQDILHNEKLDLIRLRSSCSICVHYTIIYLRIYLQKMINTESNTNY